MSIEPERDQYFQYATFGILGLTLLVCACYGLIFLNPRLNPIRSLQPPTTPQQLSQQQFPPTWTATLLPTNSPTATPTATSTDTPTEVPTDTPTDTPTLTNTPLPTATFTASPRPPTAIPRPPTPIPIYPSATPLPPVPTNTAVPQVGYHRIKYAPSPNCGTWYIQGTVWTDGEGSGLVPGVRVRVWIDGDSYRDDITGSHPDHSPGYWEMIFRKGAAGSGRIGIVDDNGNLLTPQWYSVRLTSNCTGKGAVNEIIIDFSED